jgi:Cna protein B-type domain protein
MKNLLKKFTMFMLSILTVLSMVTGLFQPVYANGGAGAGGSGGGQVTGDNPGYTVWFDQWGADGQPIQGWNEDSMNNMQARIEGMLGKTMNPNAYGGTRPYLEIYQQAAREALADAQARSQTGRARVVGVSSIYWDGGNNMQAAYDSKSNVLRLAGTRSGTAEELPDNTGWSTTYNNGDGATGANWRDWLQQYGVAKAPDTNLTMIVWAVAEGEPLPREINLTIKKSNGIPSLTLGNKCYAQDLSGAEYEVHKKADLSDAPLYTLVTDANGNASAPEKISVDPSSPFLYVKETKAPKGFALDPTVYTVSANNPTTWAVNSVDMPMNDPVAITLVKKSIEGIENPAPLEGAEFTVKYYDGQYTKETLPETPTRTWVIKTLLKGGKYTTLLGDEYKVSGDDFYLNNGIPTLPLGTVTVEETKAPNGYTLENKTLNANGEQIADGIALFNIVNDAATNIPRLSGGNEYTINEGVKRSGFNIKKIDRETNEPIGVAEFKILNPNNYDVKYVHKDGTSEIIKAGAMSEETIVTDAQGTYTSAVDALQAGTYKLIETKSPNGYLINEVTDFEVSNDAEVNTISTEITVLESKMHTRASVEETNTNMADGSKTEQTLTDTVEYHDLIVGKEYTLVNEWVIKPAGVSEEELRTMDTATFERLKNENGDVIKTTTTFIPETSDGFVTVKTKFNPSKYAGHKLVAFEDMFKEGLLVGHHANILDEAQTVTVSMDLDVRIAKADAEKVDHYLQGAEITVYNQDGTIAKDKDGKDAVGVTDKNGQVSFKLAYDQDNQMYVMETKAPEGYEISTEKYPITRTGKDKLGVDLIKINVLDNAIVIPPTGVETNPLLFVGIGVVALATLGVIFLAKKKN